MLSSACAATQTTILPGARTALSMASAGALPRKLASVHPRYLTPGIATILTGMISVAWYLSLTAMSKDVLADSITAVGLPIAFYYGLTSMACLVRYRHDLLKSVKNFVILGAIPFAGALAMLLLFMKSCSNLASAGSTTIFGVGGPLVIGLGSLLIGLPLMGLAEDGYFKGRE